MYQITSIITSKVAQSHEITSIILIPDLSNWNWLWRHCIDFLINLRLWQTYYITSIFVPEIPWRHYTSYATLKVAQKYIQLKFDLMALYRFSSFFKGSANSLDHICDFNLELSKWNASQWNYIELHNPLRVGQICWPTSIYCEKVPQMY